MKKHSAIFAISWFMGLIGPALLSVGTPKPTQKPDEKWGLEMPLMGVFMLLPAMFFSYQWGAFEAGQPQNKGKP